MRTIAIVNQKGGVGKTTTAVQLAAWLDLSGHRVLSVDLDAQGNMTQTMYGDAARQGDEPTAYDALTGASSVRDAIAHVCHGDLLPASADADCTDKRLAHIDAAIGNMPNRYYLLREALEEVGSDYDFCVVDTPPARDTCSYNALTACDAALIVTEAGEYAVKGIGDLSESIRQIRKYTNPSIEVAGVLVTKYEGQTLLARGMRRGAEQIAAALGTRVLKTRIRKAVAIGESQAERMSIFDYAPDSGVAKDYEKAINELLEVTDHGRD